MQVEIEVKGQEVRRQETKSGKTLVWQKVGMNQGADWPVVFEVFLPDGNPVPLGKHRFEMRFKADQYGSLQLDTFNCRVLPGAK